jgi:RNA methyltransferase, TrmH family
VVEQSRSARRDGGLAVVEGFHAVKHAIRFGADIVAFVGTDADAARGLSEALAPDVRDRFAESLRIVSADAFRELAPQTPATGVMAIARRPPFEPANAFSDPRPGPVVLLEDPRHLGNVGACVRVAAAADAAAVLTTGDLDPWHPEALRGAAGLHFALPVGHITELPPHDRPLIALHPEADMAFEPALIPPRAMLAFGSERNGISEELLANADQSVSIPMRAGVSSLNLATSVAAVLFAARLSATRRSDA